MKGQLTQLNQPGGPPTRNQFVHYGDRRLEITNIRSHICFLAYLHKGAFPFKQPRQRRYGFLHCDSVFSFSQYLITQRPDSAPAQEFLIRFFHVSGKEGRIRATVREGQKLSGLLYQLRLILHANAEEASALLLRILRRR